MNKDHQERAILRLIVDRFSGGCCFLMAALPQARTEGDWADASQVKMVCDREELRGAELPQFDVGRE
jgi:hypothetical protein